MPRLQIEKITRSQQKFCEDLKSYSGISACDYNQLMRNEKAAIKFLFNESKTKEVVVSSKNWVELEGFCFTGITFEVLKDLIPVKDAKIKFIGLGEMK